MITMHCDRCGEKVPPEVKGAIRFRTGKAEYVFHLCATCQTNVTELLRRELNASTWREVGN